eukprot:scaffold361_cov101-Isochrysis_galbana.AAC.1
MAGSAHTQRRCVQHKGSIVHTCLFTQSGPALAEELALCARSRRHTLPLHTFPPPYSHRRPAASAYSQLPLAYSQLPYCVRARRSSGPTTPTARSRSSRRQPWRASRRRPAAVGSRRRAGGWRRPAPRTRRCGISLVTRVVTARRTEAAMGRP